jgi:hypothetical protein
MGIDRHNVYMALDDHTEYRGRFSTSLKAKGGRYCSRNYAHEKEEEQKKREIV